MNVIKVTDKNVISEAVAVLKKGGVIIFPTETCYGIGADATNPDAVEKVIQFKGSNRHKPISVMVFDKTTAKKYVEINRSADNLYRQFLPGPVTVVSKSRGKICPKLESERKTLGIRIPDYSSTLSICRSFKKPVTATSANQTGKKSPYSLSDVIKYTSPKRLKLVDLFIDAGRLPDHLPSTVVDTTVNEIKVLRQGEIIIKGKNAKTFISRSEEETRAIAEKILKEYYGKLPKKPIIFALQGELGAGKTQFSRGIAEALNIKSNINSPTFTIIKEYPYELKNEAPRPDSSPRWSFDEAGPGIFSRVSSGAKSRRSGKFTSRSSAKGDKGIFFHIDTWRLEDGNELMDLGLREMIRPGNILAIEWQQKVRNILNNFETKKTAQVVWVVIDVVSETKRKISYFD
ncbi:MAG: L-threonylcarbamoyladenylate synthase [bacterium]